jgi:hypothetical protein
MAVSRSMTWRVHSLRHPGKHRSYLGRIFLSYSRFYKPSSLCSFLSLLWMEMDDMLDYWPIGIFCVLMLTVYLSGRGKVLGMTLRRSLLHWHLPARLLSPGAPAGARAGFHGFVSTNCISDVHHESMTAARLSDRRQTALKRNHQIDWLFFSHQWSQHELFSENKTSPQDICSIYVLYY